MKKLSYSLLTALSFQHAFAMFGASILIPRLFGIDPNTALLLNGIGTLLFIYISSNKSPAFLGSSGAFIAPTLFIISKEGLNLPIEYALGGFVFVGVIAMILSYVIYKYGVEWINVILPPAAMGSVVALIGFDLAKLTVSGGDIGANLIGDNIEISSIVIFSITLITAIIGSVMFKSFFKTIPILIAMIVGYIVSIFFGKVDFSIILNTSLFTLPEFKIAKFDINALILMLPVILVIVSEHISHQIVTSQIINRDLIKDPGLHKTLFADNLSTALSGLVGSVPTTTYGENIAVMAITKVYNTSIFKGAAIISIIMAFIGPFSALIRSIPGDVIGGVTFLLYGMIGASGLRLLASEKVDFNKAQNLILISIIFIAGLSGLKVSLLGMVFQGMNLAAMLAILLSLIFYILDKFNLMNEKWL